MDNKNKKDNKVLVIVIVLILCAIFGVLIGYMYNKNKQWTIPESSSLMKLMNYETPFDGKVELADYKDKEFYMDDILEYAYKNQIDYLKRYYEVNDINDEFIAENFSDVATTMEEYKIWYCKYVALQMAVDKESYYSYICDYVNNYIQTNSKVIKQASCLPELEENGVSLMTEYLGGLYYGGGSEEYAKNAYNLSYNKLDKQLVNEFTDRDTIDMILAYDVDMDIDWEQAHREYLEDLAAQYGCEVEDFDSIKVYDVEADKHTFITEKTIEYIVDNCITIHPATKYNIDKELEEYNAWENNEDIAIEETTEVVEDEAIENEEVVEEFVDETPIKEEIIEDVIVEE